MVLTRRAERQTPGPIELSNRTMKITQQRVKQIDELRDRIDKNTTWIRGKRDKIKAEIYMMADIPQELQEILSRSASQSRENRGRSRAVDIEDTIARHEEVVSELDGAIKDTEEELGRLEMEKEALEEYTRGA